MNQNYNTMIIEVGTKYVNTKLTFFKKTNEKRPEGLFSI